MPLMDRSVAGILDLLIAEKLALLKIELNISGLGLVVVGNKSCWG